MQTYLNGAEHFESPVNQGLTFGHFLDTLLVRDYLLHPVNENCLRGLNAYLDRYYEVATLSFFLGLLNAYRDTIESQIVKGADVESLISLLEEWILREVENQ